MAQPLEALLEKAPAAAVDVLERLAPGPPVGVVARADRPVDPTSTNPVEWLLAHGLLAVADPGHVVLPLEVGLHLRGGAAFGPDGGVAAHRSAPRRVPPGSSSAPRAPRRPRCCGWSVSWPTDGA